MMVYNKDLLISGPGDPGSQSDEPSGATAGAAGQFWINQCLTIQSDSMRVSNNFPFFLLFMFFELVKSFDHAL